MQNYSYFILVKQQIDFRKIPKGKTIQVNFVRKITLIFPVISLNRKCTDIGKFSDVFEKMCILVEFQFIHP